MAATVARIAAGFKKRVRYDTMALIGLVGGAGLRTSEAANVRPRDISTERGYLIVDVVDGTRPRAVPVDAQWAPLLNPALEERDFNEVLLLPSIRAASARAAKVRALCNVDADSPAVAKLRDTWVINQLSRVPLGVLTHVAGFTSLTSLSTRYAAFTTPANDDAATQFYDAMVGAQR